MTSKLKCPFCQTELEYDFGYDGDYSCRKCGRNKMFGSEELWQALIQSQKDLEKAIGAFEYILEKIKISKIVDPNDITIMMIEGMCEMTLEQIEHKEQI